jgi:hypothetical protein
MLYSSPPHQTSGGFKAVLHTVLPCKEVLSNSKVLHAVLPCKDVLSNSNENTFCNPSIGKGLLPRVLSP